MRTLAFVAFWFLAACGSDGWLGDCYESESVCVERETPDNLSMNGYWEGTYRTGRHFIGTNDAYLQWSHGTWRLTLERDDILREPFFVTKSMVGEGHMLKGQTNFKAPYSSEEMWYLTGSYSMEADTMFYRGRISTHGRTIGRFEMSRPRECVVMEERIKNTCDGSMEVRRNGELVYEEPPDELQTESGPADIYYTNISPNPVTPGGTLSVGGAASGASGIAWKVTFAHTTTSAADRPPVTFSRATFHEEMSAPATSGTYLVTFEAKNAEGSDVETQVLTVTASPP